MNAFCKLLFAALVLLACGCGGGGRAFKSPKTLSEKRPVRAPAMALSADAQLGDEPFRAAPPANVPAKPRPFAVPTEVKLSNGIRLVMLERHDFPSISAVLILDRGSAAGAPGVASLYSEALTGTSDEYKASEAFQYLQFVGGSVSSDAWRDATILQVTALSPLFTSALSRGAPMFTSPSFDGDDIETGQAHLAAERARAGQSPAWVASDALLGAVFPAPHPYSLPVSGQRSGGAGPPVTDAITKAMVRAFRDANLAADHVSVACVGDFKPEAIQRTFEKTLAKLPKHATGTMPAFPPLSPKSGRKVIVIDRPNAGQSSVAIGWPGPRAVDPESVALEVLSDASAGDLSTRLNITVRKELGASYGVHMAITGLRESGMIHITAAIETTRTVDALKALFAQLERLRTEPLSTSELAAAKLRAYWDYDGGSTHGLAVALASAVAHGLPPAYAVTHNARVDTVTSESVRAAAEHWLAPDELHVVIVGDASKIVPGLRTLGLGDVTVTGG